MAHGGTCRVEPRHRPVVGMRRLAQQRCAGDGGQDPGRDTIRETAAGLGYIVGDAVAALQRQIAVGDRPDLRPGAAVKTHENIVAVVGDMPARAHIVLGCGLEQADTKVAEEAHLRRRGERLVLGMPDLGIAELLHPHVAPEPKAILVAQMRWQAVGRKIDLLHWPDRPPPIKPSPDATRHRPRNPSNTEIMLFLKRKIVDGARQSQDRAPGSKSRSGEHLTVADTPQSRAFSSCARPSNAKAHASKTRGERSATSAQNQLNRDFA